MISRELYRGGPRVGAVGYGAMGLSWAYGDGVSSAQAEAIIRCAVESEATLIDTADMYGPHINERIVGPAVAARRDDVILATKGGLVVEDASSFDIRRDGRPEHLKAACEASLRRLGVDHVDLYYLHRIDPDVPVEESFGAMSELVTAGWVRAIGLSEPTVEQLDRAHAVHQVAVVQSELSLWAREPLEGVLDWCDAHGAGFVAYAPLGRGLLTGRVELGPGDFRLGLPRFQADVLASNLELVDRVRAVAERRAASPAQIALAWTLAQGGRVMAIPGTRRLDRLIENVGAGALHLDADELAELDAMPVAYGARR